MKEIPGFPDYFATKDGFIWSTKYGAPRMLKGRKSKKSGHINLILRVNGKSVTAWVHRLVLTAFVGDCPPGHECRHLNGKPDDNRLENLEWGTLSENRKDRNRHGKWNKGASHPLSKLTKSQVNEIRRRCSNGETQKSISREFGISQGHVSAIFTGKNWT